MKAALKKYFLGLVVGVLVAFPLGMNVGRDAPLFSNPFADRSVKQKVKSEAENIIENTKGAIHDATRPAQRELEQNLRR